MSSLLCQIQVRSVLKKDSLGPKGFQLFSVLDAPFSFKKYSWDVQDNCVYWNRPLQWPRLWFSMRITHPHSLSMASLLSQHHPLVLSLQFDLIWDHPMLLDIIYTFELQWAVRKMRAGSHSFCCQKNTSWVQISPWIGQRHAPRQAGLWQPSYCTLTHCFLLQTWVLCLHKSVTLCYVPP